MSEIWNTLVDIQNHLVNKFSETGVEVQEPGMDKFNKPGWLNRVWTSDCYRRAHVDVVDARDTRGLWMMHCCVFPHLHNTGPIFGLDVIAGKNKITGFFHDYSPTTDPEHPMIYDFGQGASEMEWNKPRELPEWARAIFTKHMIAAGNLTNSEELTQILDLSIESTDNYLSLISSFNFQADADESKAAQNRYAHYQKQNPHTPKTMTALGLGEQEVEQFIHECLFPDLK